MLKAFVSSFSAYVRAFDFIGRNGLWRYFLAPAVISVALGFAIFGTAWGVSDNLGGWLISFYPWEWGKPVIERIATVFGALFVLALGLILFKHLVMALASPFMSPLSEKTEEIITGRPSTATFSPLQMWSDLVRGIRLAIRNIIRELFFTFLLFLLGLIPIFSPLAPIAIFFVQAYYAGFGNMDFTLERHFRVRGSVQFVRQHKGIALATAAAFLLLLLTGIGFLVVLPLGTVAAALETTPELNVEDLP